MKILKKLRNLALGGALMLSPYLANADDIFKGVRGSTNWQLDLRASYTQRTDSKETTVKTFSDNVVLKYWDGDKIGLFGFFNIPAYKSVDNGTSESRGFGDLTFGIGPRGKISLGEKGTLHFLSYAGPSMPTGDNHRNPALGNDRLDIKTGIFSTYLTKNRAFEIDTSFEYTLAGENSKGIRGVDEMTAGAVVGGRITQDNLIRVAGGIESRFKEDLKEGWNYAYGPRAVLRITPPNKNWHLELLGDYDMASKHLPDGFSG